jgi:hypothetical protein
VLFPPGVAVSVNRAHLQLTGAAEIPALAAMHTNGGYIELRDGQHFVTAGDLSLTDYGGMVLTGGSDLRLGPDGNSTLTIAEGKSVSLQSSSTIHGNVINGGALVPNEDMTLDPLPPPPAVYGDLEQLPSGLLYTAVRKLNGVIESLPLTVTGHASLAGRFVVSFYFPYTRPALGDSFPVFRYGSYEGALTPYASLTPYQPSIVMGANEALIRFGLPNLEVRSEPMNGVPVKLDPAPAAGGATGITPFDRAYDWSASVTLTAPRLAENRRFLRWEDGQGALLTTGAALTVTVAGNLRVCAVYSNQPLSPCAPEGPFDLFPGSEDVAPRWGLWDFTGSYAEAGLGPYALTLGLLHGERGEVTGTGRLRGAAGGKEVGVGLTFRGRCQGRSGIVMLKGRLAGSEGTTAVSLALSLALNGASLQGMAYGTVTDTVGGATAVASPCVLPLPAGVDGTYSISVDLHLDPGRGSVRGTGILRLAPALLDPRTVALRGSGRGSRGTTLLHLAGDPSVNPAFNAVRCTLRIVTYTGELATIETLSGKALGQHLR